MNVLTDIYDIFLARYGDPHWWPAKTPYEVIVGAVLTQNTAWGNVEKAIENFKGKLCPELIMNADHAELVDIIRPAGFFNQKAAYLKAVTEWYAGYGFSVQNVQNEPLDKLRPELLRVKGVGRETADSILLYSFGFPTFVVDAYTVRFCERYPIDAGKGYDAIKAYFERSIPKDARVYNNYHAYIVLNGKEYCKKKPSCAACPLTNSCKKIGC